MNEEEIKEELLDFSLDSSTQNIANSTKKVYSLSIKRFLRTNPDIQNVDDYVNFLQNTVIMHYSNNNGKKRNLCYFDSLIKYCNFKRNNTEDKNEKYNYKKIIKIVKSIKPKQLQNKHIGHYLTITQRKNVISKIKEHKHKLMAKLQMHTGVRVGSVLGLKAEAGKPAISFAVVDNEVVGVIDFYKMKGGKTARKYIFDNELVKELQEYIENDIISDSEYYFIQKNKSYEGQDFETITKTNYHWYWEDLKHALALCGYSTEQWSTHDFRKNAAYDVYKTTKDPYAVKQFLNHERFETTEHYLKNQGLVKDQIKVAKAYANKLKD